MFPTTRAAVRCSVTRANISESMRKSLFVEDYKLVIKSLNRAEIIVYEKSVVGYVSHMSSYMYFDKDGIIVES